MLGSGTKLSQNQLRGGITTDMSDCCLARSGYQVAVVVNSLLLACRQTIYYQCRNLQSMTILDLLNVLNCPYLQEVASVHFESVGPSFRQTLLNTCTAAIKTLEFHLRNINMGDYQLSS